ncbi:hypothetical protein BC793_12413 [Actinoplanes xinjiangensis]|uniref:Uncharacterized protein n=2 Tax=Actinoplanes xinjiangensis TaxID=512350 RepID=A0A316EVJ7_9ACTN|nr:hypothetical protein BC793_12413 [Actinoplanes xinjiangensis]
MNKSANDSAAPPDRILFEPARKAGRIFKDYVLDLYFPAHALSWWQRVWCAPLLFLVEYLVYRVDSVTERSQHIDLEVTRAADYDTLHRYKAAFARLLRGLGVHSDAVAAQLDAGEQYVRLENRVTSGPQPSAVEVLRLVELRPSDVRLLHAMIFGLLRRPADQRMLDLLWPVEVLADIGNDISHASGDIAAGRFNTYGVFLRLYHDEAPQRLRTEIEHYERLFHERLAELPPGRRQDLKDLCERRYRPLIRGLTDLPTALRPTTSPQPEEKS